MDENTTSVGTVRTKQANWIVKIEKEQKRSMRGRICAGKRELSIGMPNLQRIYRCFLFSHFEHVLLYAIHSSTISPSGNRTAKRKFPLPRGDSAHFLRSSRYVRVAPPGFEGEPLSSALMTHITLMTQKVRKEPHIGWNTSKAKITTKATAQPRLQVKSKCYRALYGIS